MLGKGSDEKQHEAAPDMRGTCHGGWEKSRTSGTLEEGKDSLRDEGMGEDGSVTGALPLGQASVILSPNWKEGTESFIPGMRASKCAFVPSLWGLLRLLPEH